MVKIIDVDVVQGGEHVGGENHARGIKFFMVGDLFDFSVFLASVASTG